MTNLKNDAVSESAPRRRGEPLLDLANVGKSFIAHDGSVVAAIESVSCRIEKGEFVSVLGPSGCGKSTLLMIIGGLVQSSAGHIVVHGHPPNVNRPDFGIVFQDPILLPWRTVLANVELSGEAGRIEGKVRRGRAIDLLKLVGLEGFEQKYPTELSGGMQQRVAIARALMLQPSLLLMDEPFSALDAMTREQMNLEMQRISLDTGATVIFVTHSISEAAFLSDRVLVMSGRPSTVREIVDIGIPRPRNIDLLTSDRFGDYVRRMRRLFD